MVNNLCLNLYLWLWVRPSQVVRLIRHNEFWTSPTYYPECEDVLKSHPQQFWNQMEQIWKYGRLNTLYYCWGFDVKSREVQATYVHYNTFMRRRCELNKPSAESSTSVLRNKLLFSLVAGGMGLKTPETLFFSNNGELTDFATKQTATYESICALEDCRMFCKPLDGECGRGIFIMEVKGHQVMIDGESADRSVFEEHFAKGRILVQQLVEQHPALASLHPQSLNTIRLVTVKGLKDGKIHVLPSIIRIGTGESVIDNTSQGGLAVGIDMQTGFLKHYGFYKPQFGTKVEEHPDSNIHFDQFQIPYFKEALEQAKLFHSALSDIHSIGWDIAIGSEGPVFIEGNDNWEITGPQTCNGGLKREFDEYFFE